MSFEDDAAFERSLIESARADALPTDVDAVWGRLANALAVAAPTSAAAEAARASGNDLARGAGAVGAVKWIVLGALGGVALTVALMRAHESSAVVNTEVRVAPAPMTTRPIAPLSTDAPPLTPSAPLRQTRPRRGGTSEPSSLAAEVARLDTARAVISHEDYDEALRLIERYHRDFPRGALAADADVVAIEAAAAKHDAADVSRRAAIFLSRHPNDPHAARVRTLAATVRDAAPPRR